MSVGSRHLDGNAVAGDLFEAFGREMTAQRERCGGCGAVRYVAELLAYVAGPGDVLRCPECGIVLLIVTRTERRIHVSTVSMAWLDAPS